MKKRLLFPVVLFLCLAISLSSVGAVNNEYTGYDTNLSLYYAVDTGNGSTGALANTTDKGVITGGNDGAVSLNGTNWVWWNGQINYSRTGGGDPASSVFRHLETNSTMPSTGNVSIYFEYLYKTGNTGLLDVMNGYHINTILARLTLADTTVKDHNSATKCALTAGLKNYTIKVLMDNDNSQYTIACYDNALNTTQYGSPTSYWNAGDFTNQARFYGGDATGYMAIDNIYYFYGNNRTATLPPPPTNLTPRILYPVNDSQFNTLSLELSYSITSLNFTTATCQLFQNDSVLNVRNFTLPQSNQTINLSYSSTAQTDYTYIVQCNGTSQISMVNEFYNSSSVLVHIDNVLPLATSNAFSTALIQPKQFNFTFTDVNLFSYRIKFGKLNLSNQTNIIDTTINVSVTIDPTNYTPGLYDLNVTYSDGHTTLSIPTWNYDKNSITKSLTYNYGNSWVRIKSINTFDAMSDLSTNKDIDRYTFTYARGSLEKTLNGDTLKFRVESDHPIVVNNKKNYPGWLIIPELNKWVDFSAGLPSKDYVVNQVDENTVEVTINNVNEDIITFNSIGELNTVTEMYQIALANISYSYTPAVFSAQQQRMNLTIDLFNSSLVNTTSAFLNYNFTTYQSNLTIAGTKHLYGVTFTTPTTPNTTSLQFNWTFTLNLTDNTSQTMDTNTTNQTVFSFSFDDCSNNTVKMLQFYGRDEVTNELTPYTLNIDLNFTYGIAQANFGRSFEFNGETNYSICIPANTTSTEYFTVDSIMEYYSINLTGTDYTNKKYYLVDVPLNNATHDVNLYLLDTTVASEIILQTFDKNTGSSVSDAYIYVNRFYPGEGISKTVEIARSDNRGETLAKLVLADVFYTFSIIKDGTIIFQSSDFQKILTTTKRFNVDVGTDILESYRDINNIFTNVSCDKASLTCQMTWIDPTGLVANGSMNVYRFNGYGRTLLYSNSLAASSGTLSYTINETTTGNQYIAEGRIHTNTENSLYDVGQDIIAFIAGIKDTIGIVAVIPFLWMFLAVIGLFMERGAAVVLAATGLMIIIGSIFQVIPLSTPVVLGIIVMIGVFIAKMRT